MTNQAPAYVRTGVPIAAGPIIVSIAKAVGLDVTVEQVILLLPAVSFVYYVLGRALEAYNPKLGYVLGIAKAPAYAKEAAPAPGAGEDVVAVVVPENGAVEPPQRPVQTDNTPRPEDGEQLPVDQAVDGDSWSGEEMR